MTEKEDSLQEYRKHVSEAWIPFLEKCKEQGFDIVIKPQGSIRNICMNIGELTLQIHVKHKKITCYIKEPFEYEAHYDMLWYLQKNRPNGVFHYEVFEEYAIGRIDTLLQELEGENIARKVNLYNQLQGLNLHYIKKLDLHHLEQLVKKLGIE